MPLRRLLSVGAALVLVALSIVPGSTEGTDVRSQPFAFTMTRLRRPTVPINRTATFAEPSIALSAKDHAFFCGPMGIPGGINGFVRTADWQTYEYQDINDRTGGGDCDVEVGADGAVYTANLQAWASAIRKSVDDGRTFTYQTSEDPVEQDRQWLATDPVDGSIVYLAYHDWSISAIVVAKSLDGGKTFLIHSVASTDPEITARGARSGIPGTILVDPTNHNRVYMVWLTRDITDCPADAPNSCVGLGGRNVVVGRSDDGGLTWVNKVAMTAPPGSRLGLLIPWMAADAAGNIYVAAGGRIRNDDGTFTNGLFTASSTDRGITWSPRTKVNQGSGAVVFPTVIAGSAGIADFAWVESTADTTADESGQWTLRFAQSRDATSVTPAFTEVVGPVVHKTDVCVEGLGCLVSSGNRNLLDFIDMDLDSFGYAHIAAFSDVSGEVTIWWRQDAGPSAMSEPCAVDGAPDCVTVRPGPRP